VAQAIGDPCQDVEDGVRVRREDIGEIGAIENVFKGRENTDPDMRSYFCGDEAANSSNVRNPSLWFPVVRVGKSEGGHSPTAKEIHQIRPYW
jgi:hypothetical protein